jgi:hypothetical protein
MALVAFPMPADLLFEGPASQPQFQGFPNDVGATPLFRFHGYINGLQERFIYTNRNSFCHAGILQIALRIVKATFRHAYALSPHPISTSRL